MARKKISFLILFLSLNTFLSFSQKTDKQKTVLSKFSISTQGLFLSPHLQDGNIKTPGYEIESNSYIQGFNVELNYNFNQYFLLGFGTGIEKLTQPAMKYYPVYLKAMGNFFDRYNSCYIKFNFGTHLGEIDKTGFVFRSGIGYKVPIIKKVTSYFEFTYFYQNISKTYTNSGRIDNYYNLEGVGITIGIELN